MKLKIYEWLTLFILNSVGTIAQSAVDQPIQTIIYLVTGVFLIIATIGMFITISRN